MRQTFLLIFRSLHHNFQMARRYLRPGTCRFRRHSLLITLGLRHKVYRFLRPVGFRHLEVYRRTFSFHLIHLLWYQEDNRH